MKFDADTSDLKKLEKVMKRFPIDLREIVAKTLTKQAADMKFKHIPDSLKDSFVIRSEKFMERQIKYKKAQKGAAPGTNFSEVGSVERDRFTGWEEQQTGTAPDMERVASQASRTGMNFAKTMKTSSRLKSGNEFRRPADYRGPKLKTRSQKTWAMLFESRKERVNFILRKNDSRPGRLYKLKPGLYGWVGKRLYRLQKFDTKYDPKRTDWMGNSIKRLVRKRGGFEAVFRSELKKALIKSGLQ